MGFNDTSLIKRIPVINVHAKCSRADSKMPDIHAGFLQYRIQFRENTRKTRWIFAVPS